MSQEQVAAPEPAPPEAAPAAPVEPAPAAAPEPVTEATESSPEAEGVAEAPPLAAEQPEVPAKAAKEKKKKDTEPEQEQEQPKEAPEAEKESEKVEDSSENDLRPADKDKEKETRIKIVEPEKDAKETKEAKEAKKARKRALDGDPDADPSALEDDIDQMLLDDYDDDSDSEDSLASAASYLFQKEIEVVPDFFEVLGEIPPLDEISLDSTVLEVAASASRLSISEADAAKDVGKFVDPLTGEVLSSEEEPPPPPPPPAEEPADDEGEEEEDSELLDDDDLLLAPDMDDDLELAKKLPDEGSDAGWFDLEPTATVQIEEPIDIEALEREEAARALAASTNEFLDQLIGRIVDQCEYIDPNTILRQSLDKGRLMGELQSKLAQLDIEQKARFFLNRKTVEYFRRKKAFRSILEDPPDTIAQAIEKYKEATTALDQLLGREEETRQVTELKIENLESEVFDMEETSRLAVQALEELVRKTLCRENFDKMAAVVENQLQRMATLRAEISSVRYVLIQRQHSLATLMEKSEKLENLGNGLRMQDFEHLQTETQALGKKIEERNNELNKLRTRCNADLHIMAHMKEKQQMLRNTISIQESALQEMLEEKQSCREYLYELKMERGRIRREIQELSFQGGLIDKPALMLDYDATEDRLEKLRAKVDQMKVKYAEIQQRILAIESQCDRDD